MAESLYIKLCLLTKTIYIYTWKQSMSALIVDEVTVVVLDLSPIMVFSFCYLVLVTTIACVLVIIFYR